jgi:hypothetical protein
LDLNAPTGPYAADTPPTHCLPLPFPNKADSTLAAGEVDPTAAAAGEEECVRVAEVETACVGPAPTSLHPDRRLRRVCTRGVLLRLGLLLLTHHHHHHSRQLTTVIEIDWEGVQKEAGTPFPVVRMATGLTARTKM